MTKLHQIDLDAYFARISYQGPRQPNLENLNAIIGAHVGAVPFENLDIILGRGISIAPADIERKLVQQGRGGYCFEQNNLMGLVLEQMGFQLQRISARVTYRKPESFLPPRTHVFLRVELDGVDWLVDVGVGVISPTCALRLELDTTQETPHEARRIVASGLWSGMQSRSPDALLRHQVLFDGEWKNVCEFTLEEMHPIDCELGNWFTSAHPESHFLTSVMVARAVEGGRVSLSNQILTHRKLDGSKTQRTLATEQELLEALESEFGLHLGLEADAGLLERIAAT